MEPKSHQTGAYTSPPKIRKAGANLVPIGAGVAAAAAGLVWILAPGFRSQKAPTSAPAAEAPAFDPGPSMPKSVVAAAPVAAVATIARPEAAAVNAAPAALAATGEEQGTAEGAKPPVSRPAWANAGVKQNWTWPRHLSIRNDEGAVVRRLVGWFPANPAAKRMLYSLTVDRVETRLYEDEIAAFGLRLAEEIAQRQREEAEEAARAAQEAQAKAAAAQVQELAAPEMKALDTAAQANQALAAQTPAAPAPGAAPAKARPAKRASMSGRGGSGAPLAAQLGNGPAFGGVVAGAGGALGNAIGMPAAAGIIADALMMKIPTNPAEFAAWLKELRAVEMKNLQKKSGAVESKDVTGKDGRPMAELTYADGRKEIVPYDPLVFDLKGTGVKTTPKKVLFDLYGYGKGDKTQWMNDLEEGTGILVFDADGKGGSGKNGGEVFGDRTDLTGVGQPTGFANGFAALNALAIKAVDAGVLKRDVLDQRVLDAEALTSLEKTYGLKIKTGGFNGKTVSLASAGIKAIALSQEPAERARDFDGQSNDLLVQPGAIFLRTDGTTGTYMNIWLKAKIGNLGLMTVDHLEQRR